MWKKFTKKMKKETNEKMVFTNIKNGGFMNIQFEKIN